MKPLALATIIALACASGAPAQSIYNPSAPAQPAPYGSTRILSPYMNLLRGGDPAVNYFLGVLPEQQRRYFMSQPPLSIQMPMLDRMVDDRADVEVLEKRLPPSGHAAGFMMYNAYFNIPNQRGFLPYNPRPMGQQQMQMQNYR